MVRSKSTARIKLDIVRMLEDLGLPADIRRSESSTFSILNMDLIFRDEVSADAAMQALDTPDPRNRYIGELEQDAPDHVRVILG